MSLDFMPWLGVKLTTKHERIRLGAAIAISELTYTNDYDYEDEINEPSDMEHVVKENTHKVKSTAHMMCLVNHCLNGGCTDTVNVQLSVYK